jgi:hypothetical protein
MSTVNVSVLYNGDFIFRALEDDKVAAAAITTQPTATPINSAFARFTIARDGTNNAAILKSVNEVFGLTVVVNDAPNTIQVFCAAGEKMNGSSNGSLALLAGQTGVFWPVPNQLSGAPDWRAAAIS